MTTNYIRLADEKHKVTQDPVEEFALDVLMGLTSKPKYLSPRYLYDTRGSELFQKITDTEDYYPTNCEADILRTHRESIAKLITEQKVGVVELGAGDGRKTKILLESFADMHEVVYRPIDISESAVQGITEKFANLFPKLSIKGIVAEYFEALRWLAEENAGVERNLVLFLGSNIGNFNRGQSEVFLRTLWNALNPGDYVLVGFDLKKDIDVMLRAYNDSEGQTKAFNLNLLERMNRELGANFDLNTFSHFGTYNVKLGAMESFLLSKEHQEVEMTYLNKRFVFKPYEAIHVEYSFKFLASELSDLADSTGFEVVGTFYDEKRYFADSLLQVKKLKS